MRQDAAAGTGKGGPAGVTGAGGGDMLRGMASLTKGTENRPASPSAVPLEPGEAIPRPHPPLWLLALVTFSGTLAMHIFVPALPSAARSLGVGAGAMQGAITFYLIGLACGQLFYGPLADRFGRRPVLISGLMLYTFAGFVALFAPGIGSLSVARFFQALGGCAGLALGRAMVRDSAEPQAAASRLALLNLMVSAGPGLAPALGGALVALFDWRAIFGLLAAVGLGLLLLCWRRLPETGQMRTGIRAGHVMRDYLRLLRSPAFLGFTLGGACTTTSMYGFISASPFIFVNELHRPVQEVGLYLAVMVLGLSAGSLVASRLVRRSGIDRVMIGASLAGLLGACLFLGVVLSGHMSVALIMPPLVLFTFGSGMASPMALTRAISVNPAVIGSAAGLYGCAQMGWGALCSALVAIGGDPAVGAGLVLVGGCAIGQMGFWIAGRSRRATASRDADAR